MAALPQERAVGVLPKLWIGQIAGADRLAIAFQGGRGRTIAFPRRTVTGQAAGGIKIPALSDRLRIGGNGVLLAGRAGRGNPGVAWILRGIFGRVGEQRDKGRRHSARAPPKPDDSRLEGINQRHEA